MRYDNKGNPAVKSIKVRVFAPDGKSKSRDYRAPSGRVITEAGIQQFLEGIAGNIETQFPRHEYALVPISGGGFNFVCRGLRA